MPLGATIKRCLGPRLETHVASRYRALYIDLDDLAATIASLGPYRTVVDVGCGDGLLTRLVARDQPDADVLGIDVVPPPVADEGRVRFEQLTAAALRDRAPRSFDLVLVADVLHHVPVPERTEFLAACADLVADGGILIVKEWERGSNPFHALAYVSDRYVSGDATVSFLAVDEIEQLTRAALPAARLAVVARIPPRRNNVLLAYRRIPEPQPASS
jgi:2-polyprenyl-3-methyl-5-hydroxy-6-metoxy-1,4-benzoquinol methylase